MANACGSRLGARGRSQTPAFGCGHVPRTLSGLVHETSIMSEFFRSITSSNGSGGAVLEVAMTAYNLVNLDLLSKSDPFIILFMRDGGALASKSEDVSMIASDGPWRAVGMTETVWDSLEPNWVHKFRFAYVTDFDMRQRIRMDVLDRDSESSAVNKHDFIGRAECALSDIVNAPMQKLEIVLSNASGKVQKRRGTLVLHAERVLDKPAHSLTLDVGFRESCILPAKKGFFFTVSRTTLSGDFCRVYLSGVVVRPQQENDSDLLFQSADLRDSELFMDDPARLIRFELFRKDKSGRGAHEQLLYFQMSAAELEALRAGDAVNVRMPAKTKSLQRGSVQVGNASWNVDTRGGGLLSLRFADFCWSRGLFS
ncbi:Copine-8 [Porphyridium purpureum]|uniref:Copine-8 n=1 Tax=Porphyridium purpureum TaxID=35688 RepID=A0A5J4YQY6_PORPP|nr:Copine-8 [Porphyridium purpureum]|eukprot:POR6704..scf236_6